jgi:photosystem II stability/assembly factor-like uncharacterized protein
VRRIFSFFVVSSLVFSAAAVLAAPKAARTAPEARPLGEQFGGLKFRNVGPSRGGRSTAVTGVRGQPMTFYFGGTGGGVWKTTDGGSNWLPMSDKDFKTGSVGAIAVSESDSNVVYVGMGESPIRGNLSDGDGVYRSTDAGKSWKSVGLQETRHISKVIVHPKDEDLVYVAAQGNAFRASEERGVYRSSDGGKNWKRVLFVDDKTGACDLSMDPGNPRILYAAFWQAVRRPWEFVSGGPGSSLFRSTDGGDTWKKLEEGLPKGDKGRIGVAASGARPGRVFAIVEAEKGGLFESDDYGEKWTKVNDEHKIRERPWYYSWITLDPKNADVVYLPNIFFYKSVDAGHTFASMVVPHGDNHILWIDPDDSNRMILGNDGGATISYNAGKTWSTQDNQPTAQFYRLATDDRFPYWLYGAQQDNSSPAIPSGLPAGGTIGLTDWYDVAQAESGWIAPDPRDPEIVYAGGYGGALSRFDHRTKSYREIDPWPQLAAGHKVSDLKYRFQWNAPLLISRWDPKVIYHAAQKLMRSTNEGQSFEEVSPDLTRNDPSKQGYSGGTITHDITGVEVYDSIFALAESPLEAGLLWAGTDDGLIHITRDNCKTWQNVTPKGIPEWIQINSIEASPRDKGKAYVAATMYKLGDSRPYLFKTSDYGRSWQRIDEGIPEGAFARVVREDPARPGMLFAGTERGLYLSFDDGAHWQPFQRNLPTVPITDLQVKNGDLVVATQGRAFWILDDLSALRQWNDSVASSASYLFALRPSVRMQADLPAEDEAATPRPYGANLPSGVVIDYWLKEKPGEKSKIAVEILSGDTLLRKYTNEKKEEPKKDAPEAESAPDPDRQKPIEPNAGLNRLVWDLRILKPTLVPRATINEGERRAPKVGPGRYTVRLTVDGQVSTRTAEVIANPALRLSPADVLAQYELLAKLRDRLSDSHSAVLKIRDLKDQIKSISDHARKIGKKEPIASRADALTEKLKNIEVKLINPEIKAVEDDLNFEPALDHDISALAGVVSTGDGRPTDSSVAYFGVLDQKLHEVLRQLQQVVDTDLAEFNRTVVDQKIAPVTLIPKVGEDE